MHIRCMRHQPLPTNPFVYTLIAEGCGKGGGDGKEGLGRAGAGFGAAGVGGGGC